MAYINVLASLCLGTSSAPLDYWLWRNTSILPRQVYEHFRNIMKSSKADFGLILMFADHKGVCPSL